MEFVDAHFHLWDAGDAAASTNVDVLGGVCAAHPQFLLSTLRTQVEDGSGVKLVGAVHVEALAKDGLDELKWVDQAAEKDAAGSPQAIVGRIDLSRPDAGEQLDQFVATSKRLRGIRQILNFEPSWPWVDHGDYMTSDAFQAGYSALEKHGLSFDLQCNPHQLKDAAALATKFPKTPVVLNHLGTLKLGTEGTSDEDAIALWWAGMEALAKAGDHVSVKLSMLCYTDKDWDRPGSVVPGLVRRVIDLFGPDRCMFASNYPVDIVDGFAGARLFKGLAALCAHLPAEDRQKLYSGTARRVYRLDC